MLHTCASAHTISNEYDIETNRNDWMHSKQIFVHLYCFQAYFGCEFTWFKILYRIYSSVLCRNLCTRPCKVSHIWKKKYKIKIITFHWSLFICIVLFDCGFCFTFKTSLVQWPAEVNAKQFYAWLNQNWKQDLRMNIEQRQMQKYSKNYK